MNRVTKSLDEKVQYCIDTLPFSPHTTNHEQVKWRKREDKCMAWHPKQGTLWIPSLATNEQRKRKRQYLQYLAPVLNSSLSNFFSASSSTYYRAFHLFQILQGCRLTIGCNFNFHCWQSYWFPRKNHNIQFSKCLIQFVLTFSKNCHYWRLKNPFKDFRESTTNELFHQI